MSAGQFLTQDGRWHGVKVRKVKGDASELTQLRPAAVRGADSD